MPAPRDILLSLISAVDDGAPAQPEPSQAPLEAPAVAMTAAEAPDSPLSELKANIEHLSSLHGRLSFMLRELEELVNLR